MYIHMYIYMCIYVYIYVYITFFKKKYKAWIPLRPLIKLFNILKFSHREYVFDRQSLENISYNQQIHLRILIIYKLVKMKRNKKKKEERREHCASTLRKPWECHASFRGRAVMAGPTQTRSNGRDVSVKPGGAMCRSQGVVRLRCRLTGPHGSWSTFAAIHSSWPWPRALSAEGQRKPS